MTIATAAVAFATASSTASATLVSSTTAITAASSGTAAAVASGGASGAAAALAAAADAAGGTMATGSLAEVAGAIERAQVGAAVGVLWPGHEAVAVWCLVAWVALGPGALASGLQVYGQGSVSAAKTQVSSQTNQ
jgi:hypothetical protein